MAEMLLADRQALMRELAGQVEAGTVDRKDALATIKKLIRMERRSAEGSQATIDRSDHDHVKKSGLAALRNREATIENLGLAVDYLKHGHRQEASSYLIKAANCGGKKSVKAARKTPTVALYVQYLAETNSDFQNWLVAHGVTV